MRAPNRWVVIGVAAAVAGFTAGTAIAADGTDDDLQLNDPITVEKTADQLTDDAGIGFHDDSPESADSPNQSAQDSAESADSPAATAPTPPAADSPHDSPDSPASAASADSPTSAGSADSDN